MIARPTAASSGRWSSSIRPRKKARIIAVRVPAPMSTIVCVLIFSSNRSSGAEMVRPLASFPTTAALFRRVDLDLRTWPPEW